MWRLGGSSPARTYDGMERVFSLSGGNHPCGAASAGGSGARSTATKPHVRCVASQNGLVEDCPHRQRATFSPATVYSLPSQSTIVTGPVTKYGPLSRTLIRTSLTRGSFGSMPQYSPREHPCSGALCRRRANAVPCAQSAGVLGSARGTLRRRVAAARLRPRRQRALARRRSLLRCART